MVIVFSALQLWAGLLYAQLMEWVLHKYVLHGIGKKRDAPFSFHFHEHHRASRTQLFQDDHYKENPWGWNAAGKETYSLIGLAILHLPVAVVLPFFWLGSVLSAVRYFHVHRKAHLDPEWCKRKIPWHYDHHMGPNPDMNWGVTTDLFDRLLGSRQVYLGTEREQRETARRERRLAKKSARRKETIEAA